MENKSSRKLFIMYVSSCLFIGTSTYTSIVISAEKIPSFIQQQSMNKRAVRGCPEPLVSKWHRFDSQTSNVLPYRDPTDNPLVGTRKFLDSGLANINKLFSHTFKTNLPKKDCCVIKRKGRAYLLVYGKGTLPEQGLIGNEPTNDLFVSVEQGMLIPPNGAPAAPFGHVNQNPSSPITNNWNNFRWKQIPISYVISNNLYSYGLGDDTHIKKTQLWVETCCIQKERRGKINASKARSAGNRSAVKRFMQRMNADKGSKPRSAPSLPPQLRNLQNFQQTLPR